MKKLRKIVCDIILVEAQSLFNDADVILYFASAARNDDSFN